MWLRRSSRIEWYGRAYVRGLFCRLIMLSPLGLAAMAMCAALTAWALWRVVWACVAYVWHA